jgi:hypothetical protein
MRVHLRAYVRKRALYSETAATAEEAFLLSNSLVAWVKRVTAAKEEK